MSFGTDDSGSSEAALVARAKNGDHIAFHGIVELHSPRLLRVAIAILRDRADAEEAVQDAFAQAWLKLQTFDATRPLAPWLARITINKARDIGRRLKWRSFLVPQYRDDAPDVAGEDPTQSIIDRDLLRHLQIAIARLPVALREPFVLVTIDGRSQAEAAEILAITERAVETRIYRARLTLKKIIAVA